MILWLIRKLSVYWHLKTKGFLDLLKHLREVESLVPGGRFLGRPLGSGWSDADVLPL